MPDSDARRAEPTVVVGILGRIRARSGGQELDLGGPRQRALLAALAVAVGRTVPTDTLIDAVWDGDPPDAADKTFRSYVSRLRKALGRAGVDGAEVVRTDAAGYRLDGQLTATDAQLFEAEVADARQHLAAGQAAAAASELAAALERWEGQALGAFADRVWAAPTSVRLEEQRLAAEELLVRALLDADRTADAVTRIEHLAVAEPLRESVARLHALALHRAGRDADALRTAREFRDRLVDEHGLDPSPQLAELESMILDRDPRLDRSVGGRRLRGYVLHEPIARSPLGTVHRAEQPSIGREVAVTVLPPERADDPELVRAFEARVQAVAGLEHPHVLPVYDYWREPGGAYVVTRFPSGGTLDQRLRSGALEVDEALRIGEQVAGALAAAHEVGVVHGEVGPDAVVVDERGDAFVWAFSLAGDVHASDDVAGLAALVTSAVAGEASGGGVATAQLPPPAARAVERATTPTDDEVVTAAALASAFAAGRAGEDELPVVPVPTGPNPYRGLAAFRETDADVFFGRDELVEQLLARIARTRAVAVVGPSGSGKSSVVRAGVLPQLRAEGAFVTTMVPGTRPLAELEVALSRVAAVELPGIADEVAATPAGLGRVVRRLLPGAGGELMLVVDQFEELFTLSEPTERDLLLQALLAVVDDPDAPVRVVATVRADFLGRVLSHATAGPLVRDRAVMVTPLTDDELHQVVVGPAEVAGVAVEPALATAIVADAARAPGSLPMVQFALTEVFEAAEDGTMTLDAYRRIGGIEGVLGQRAEEVFDGLGDADQRAAHQLFQRLVVPNADGPPTRRRAPRTELAHVPDEVIESFGRARLLRFDHDQETREPTVEVTHEALFRAWPRLVAWIEEDEDDLRLLGHLTVAAHEWDDGGRVEADLYRGNRLDAAMDFADGRRRELSEVERDFLDASRARRQRDAEADRRSVQRLRVLTGGLAVGLVLALIAGVLAVTAQREEAATAAAAQADAIAFAARATVAEDPELAALLAAEAHAAAPDAESQQALLDVLSTEPRVRRIHDDPNGARCGDQPPIGDVMAFTISTEEATYADVRRFDLTEVARVPIASATICAGVDPTGSWVYGSDESGRAVVHDAESGEVLGERTDVAIRGFFNNFMEVHPTEPRGVLSTLDGGLVVVELPSLRTITEVDIPAGVEVGGAAFGEVGEVVAISTRDDRLGVASASGEVAWAEPARPVLGAVAAEAADLLVGTTPEGLVVTSLSGPDEFTSVSIQGLDPLSRPAVSPDGTSLAVVTTRGVQMIDLPSLELRGRPIEIDTTFTKLSWDRSGRLLKTGPAAVVIMEPDRPVGVGEVVGVPPPSQFGAWPSADGLTASVFGDDGTTWVDLVSGEEVVMWETSEVDPDGRLGAVKALTDRAWARLDLGRRVFERWQEGELVRATPLPADLPADLVRVWGLLRVDHGRAVVVANELVAPLPDNRVAASWVLAFDLDTGELVTRIRKDIDEARFAQARALLDGNLVVTTYEGDFQVVDPAGEVIVSRQLGASGEFIGVSPSGDRVAFSGFADEIVVVDDQLQPVGRLTGVASQARVLRFAGGDRLVSWHTDGTTHVWDIGEMRLLGRLLDTPDEVGFAMETTPDGSAVIQTTQSGIARVPLTSEAWLGAVCSLVQRSLRQDELDAVAPGRELLDPCGGGEATAWARDRDPRAPDDR